MFFYSNMYWNKAKIYINFSTLFLSLAKLMILLENTLYILKSLYYGVRTLLLVLIIQDYDYKSLTAIFIIYVIFFLMYCICIWPFDC